MKFHLKRMAYAVVNVFGKGESEFLKINMWTIYLLIGYLAVCESKTLSVPFQFAINKNTTQKITLGKKAIIDCETDLSNAKVTLWKINGKQKTEVVASRDVLVNDNEYVLNSVLSKDIGTYMCRADNSGQVITRFIDINIDRYKPALEIKPTKKHTMEILTKTTVVLVCEGVGGFTIQWKFKHLQNWSELKPSKYTITNTKVAGFVLRSVLVLHHVTSGLSGHVECRLDTSRSRKPLREYVSLLIRDSQVPFIQKPNSKTIILAQGKHQMLKCVGDGFPSVSTSWEKDGKPMQVCTMGYGHPCSRYPYLKLTETTIKIASAVYPRDNGTYTCIVKNQFGSARKDFHVIVSKPPVLNQYPRTVVEVGHKPHTITCKANAASPPPTFRWNVQFFYNGHVKVPVSKVLSNLVKMGHKIQVSPDRMSSSIIVPSYISSAYYHCIATNVAGKATHKITFIRI